MKRCILLFLITSISFVLKSQDDFTKTYYPQINKAELEIVQGNYKKALLHYKKAFKSIKVSGFGKDYYNASMCCNLLGELELGFKYIEKIIGKGVAYNFFKMNEHHFENLIYDTRWDDIMTEYQSRQTASFGRTVSVLIQGTLGEILFRDTESREARKRGEKVNVVKSDSLNIASLLKIVAEEGFPREEVIGMRNATDISNDFYQLVILHHMRNWSKDRQKVDLRPMIKEWIKEGRMYPETGMDFINFGNSLVEREYPVSYGRVNMIRFMGDDSFYTKNYTAEEMREIDKQRSELGLESIKEYESKQAFQIENGLRESRFQIVRIPYDMYPIEFKEEMNLKKIE